MTWKQALFILFVNAIVSTLISVVVVLLVVSRSDVSTRMGPPGEQASAPPPQAGQTARETATASAAEVETTPFPTLPFLYVVQPGDTLSSLSVQFDVPAAEIIAFNQIPNPDFLPAGVELVIPVGPRAQTLATEGGPSAAVWTPVLTATNTPLPFEPPSATLTATAEVEPGATQITPTLALSATGQLRVEITAIVGLGELQQERVVISNVGSSIASLDGWSLSDDEGSSYWFPDFPLWTQASLIVATRVGQDGEPPQTLYWGRLQSAWSSGEAATLRNAAGDVVATYPIR